MSYVNIRPFHSFFPCLLQAVINVEYAAMWFLVYGLKSRRVATLKAETISEARVSTEKTIGEDGLAGLMTAECLDYF